MEFRNSSFAVRVGSHVECNRSLVTFARGSDVFTCSVFQLSTFRYLLEKYLIIAQELAQNSFIGLSFHSTQVFVGRS